MRDATSDDEWRWCRRKTRTPRSLLLLLQTTVRSGSEVSFWHWLVTLSVPFSDGISNFGAKS